MSGQDEATPRRVFGAMLKHYRIKAGWSQDKLAGRLHYSDDTISKVEMGERTLTGPNTAVADDALDAGGALVELRRTFGSTLDTRSFHPGWFAKWANIEAAARRLCDFELAVVPGLLQTESYARALLNGRTHPGDVDQRVAARLARQAVLEGDDPAELCAVIDEAVLHRPVGGPLVMQEQLERLLEAAQRPNVIIQVLAFGTYDGVNGSFAVAHRDGAPPVAYLDTAARGQVLEDPAEVTALLRLWENIRADALPRSASLDLIEKVTKQWT